MKLTDICCLSRQLVGELHGKAFHFCNCCCAKSAFLNSLAFLVSLWRRGMQINSMREKLQQLPHYFSRVKVSKVETFRKTMFRNTFIDFAFLFFFSMAITNTRSCTHARTLFKSNILLQLITEMQSKFIDENLTNGITSKSLTHHARLYIYFF